MVTGSAISQDMAFPKSGQGRSDTVACGLDLTRRCQLSHCVSLTHIFSVSIYRFGNMGSTYLDCIVCSNIGATTCASGIFGFHVPINI